MLFNISCFYFFLLVSGPAVIGHSCCGVPAKVLSVCLFVCLFALTKLTKKIILHFSERQTKTRSGSHPRNVQPIKPKAFTILTFDLPRERDPVVVFKVYSEKRPEPMNKPNAPFYLSVNHIAKVSDASWFKANAMGVNKLNSLKKTMAEKAGLDNSHLMNHNARKLMIMIKH